MFTDWCQEDYDKGIYVSNLQLVDNSNLYARCFQLFDLISVFRTKEQKKIEKNSKYHLYLYQNSAKLMK